MLCSLILQEIMRPNIIGKVIDSVAPLCSALLCDDKHKPVNS